MPDTFEISETDDALVDPVDETIGNEAPDAAATLERADVEPEAAAEAPTHITESFRAGSYEVRLETGEIATQAGGAIVLHVGDTVLLATATAAPRPGPMAFLPLTVEYRKRMAAAGRIPGSYHRRDGQGTELDTLSSRLVDRSLRPLVDGAWRCDTQVIVDPLSYDPDTDPDALAITAASAALCLSQVPFDGPVIGVRVGAQPDGAPIAFPTPRQLEEGGLDLLIAVGAEGGVVMLEGGGHEVPEAVVIDAIALAERAARPIADAIRRLVAQAGRPKREAAPLPALAPERVADLRALAAPALRAALAETNKAARKAAITAARASATEAMTGEDPTAVEAALEDLVRAVIREEALEGRRIGGRGPADVRAIGGRAGWLKRCHGSSLFTRGETQAIVTCTLGTERDAQQIETLEGQRAQRFMLHYHFPPYSTGEARPLRGPGRREIGHGHLARRALLPVLPTGTGTPPVLRLESIITGSNGSSSMASVCGGTLALLDAGVELTRPVAGIAMGLVAEGERAVVLSDILGDEDHIGDMDFKVAGTERGVTAIQLDNKLGAVPSALMAQALDQARAGRMHILARMAAILGGPRAERAQHAPRMEVIQIEPSRSRDLIGQGGKNIKSVQALGVQVDVDQATGVVRLFAQDEQAMAAARKRIDELAGVPRVGERYRSTVVTVKPFGVFVRLFEGIDGMLPDPSLTEGTVVTVEVLGVNRQGRLDLRRVPDEPEGA